MKWPDSLQQKLPLTLHKTGILEGSEIIVCSVLHTPIRDRSAFGARKQKAKEMARHHGGHQVPLLFASVRQKGVRGYG